MRLKAQNNKLADYSLLSGAFILMHQGAVGQVVYTDLEPDLELSLDGDVQFLDIDNNGTFDFGFLKTSFSYSYFSTFSASYRQVSRRGLWAGPYESGNELAGEYFTLGGTVYEPYKLDYLDFINLDLSFQVAPFQLMALVTKRLDIPDDWTFENGKWHGITNNKYLGIRFENEDGCRHYGWIRCTIEENASKLIIHDYAYESNCDAPIAAGDTIGDTTTNINDNLVNQIFISSDLQNIYLTIPESGQTVNISLINLSGQVVYNENINTNISHITPKLPSGIYIAMVELNGKFAFKKVALWQHL